MTTRNPPNPSIGTVPCPIPDCGSTCHVKRFRHLAVRDLGKRTAGRMYFDCPRHGRFGFDGKAEMQEYILEHGRITGDAPPATQPEPPPQELPQNNIPAPSPPAAKPAPKKPGGWGFFNG